MIIVYKVDEHHNRAESVDRMQGILQAV